MQRVGIAGGVSTYYTSAGVDPWLPNAQLPYRHGLPGAKRESQYKFRNPGEIMKKLVSIAALFSLVISGCSLSTGPSEVRVDVTTSLAKFKSGDAVEITVSVTNNSNEAVTIPVTSCPSHYAVRDAAGTIVGPPSEICTAQAIVKTLAPNENMKFVTTWHGEGFVNAQGQTTFLTPGTYTIEGFFGINSDNHPATVEITQ